MTYLHNLVFQQKCAFICVCVCVVGNRSWNSEVDGTIVSFPV